ncbi:MAG TPA: Trk system potassium transporter TrkA [Syntrophomonadaceae bacterium]|nr:Trk system potassium transporter TrkA [Syntrophomonadaceae bacterium]
MKAIIIGAGKVGFSIAQLLSDENHDVVVIEQDEERAQLVDQVLDVQVINGSGASWKVLESAGVRHANMVVAVTEIDELNMIACLLAKQYGVKTTVARVRNTEYVETPQFSPESLLGIDMIINPERVTALEIAKIVANPEALNVEYYSQGQVQMVELLVEEKSPLAGVRINTLDSSKYVIVAITRKNRTIVPSGSDSIYAGDHIYVVANTHDMPEVLRSIGIKRHRVENVIILGGGRTGCYIAQILEKKRLPLNIKIIEKDPKRAREVSHLVKNTLVINGDGSDLELLESENVGQADIYIAVSNDDKLNLLSSLIARNLGVPKTIAKVKRSDIMPLMQQVGVDVVFSPRLLTAGAILKYIRRGDIISVTVLGEEHAEMIELVVQPKSIAADKELSKIRFPRGSVLGAIVREDAVIIPTGKSIIRAGDKLMVFTLPTSIHKVEKLFINGGKH